MSTSETQIIQALAELGITLPPAPKPGGSYVSVNRRGNIAYVAIQFPMQGERSLYPLLSIFIFQYGIAIRFNYFKR
jgi:hypothetical protein